MTSTTIHSDEDRKVAAIVALLDEMLVVIAEENGRLADGLPASLAQSVARKTQLSVDFENFLSAMRRGDLDVHAASPSMLATLIARLTTLKPLMDDNTRRIRASMLATRRRIDAIMQALRGERTPARGYGADSRIVRRSDARGSQWA